MEEINEKRNILQQKLNHYAHAGNNANHRKGKSKLLKQLKDLDEKARKILQSKIDEEKISIEEYQVEDINKYTTSNGCTYYPTWYTPINNDPAVFIGNESILKNYKIFPKSMRNEEIRKILCEQQEENDKINKAEEEEEEYENIVIPKTAKKKNKSSK